MYSESYCAQRRRLHLPQRKGSPVASSTPHLCAVTSKPQLSFTYASNCPVFSPCNRLLIGEKAGLCIGSRTTKNGAYGFCVGSPDCSIVIHSLTNAFKLAYGAGCITDPRELRASFEVYAPLFRPSTSCLCIKDFNYTPC